MTQNEIARFSGDKSVYIRVHIYMALGGAALLTGLLLLQGNPDWWIGIAGSFAGIAMRGYYAASEQLGFEWVLTPTHLHSPSEASIPLANIETIKSVFGSVQVVTFQGDKHLIKYQATPSSVIAEISRAKAANG